MKQSGPKVKSIIVITGATSAFMNELIDLLIPLNDQLVAVTRDLRKIDEQKKVRWIECDLSNPLGDFSFLENAEMIIHAAAISNAYDPEEYYLNNVVSTKNLVDASRKYAIKKFIYISSILAGEHSGNYGKSKLASEEYIRSSVENWIIIRPSQVYGYFSKYPIDKLISSIGKNKIVLCPLGDHRRIMPIYYKELAQIIFEISFKKEESNAIYQITGPETFNYKELVLQISQVLNKKILLIRIPKFVVLSMYYILKKLNVKIGIYPDKLFRFYNEAPVLRQPIRGNFTLEHYVQDFWRPISGKMKSIKRKDPMKLKILFSNKNDWKGQLTSNINKKKHKCSFAVFDKKINYDDFDLVIPLKNIDQLFLNERGKVTNLNYLIPPNHLISLADDKLEFNRFLTKNHFDLFIPPAPAPGDFPFILKNKTGQFGKDCYIIHKEEDEIKLAEYIGDTKNYYLQTFIKGAKEYSTHVIYDKGIIYHSTFEYTYNTEIYVKGINTPDYELKKVETPFLSLWDELLKLMNYQGIGCFNYKIETNKPWIFEFNPRFGASLVNDISTVIEVLYKHLSNKSVTNLHK